MSITLENWVRERYPEIAEVYDAWAAVGFRLERGQWVVTLKSGFSGYAGRECQFIQEEKREDGTVFQYTFGYIGDDGVAELNWGVKPSELYSWVKPIEHSGIA